MKSLVNSANKGWKLVNKDKWFGNTYQLTSPSNWGQHYLLMNINIAIINHLKKAFSIMDKTINFKAKNKKYTILGRQSIAHQSTESNHRKTKSNIIPKINSHLQKKISHQNTNQQITHSFLSSPISKIPEIDTNTPQNRSTITTDLHTKKTPLCTH